MKGKEPFRTNWFKRMYQISQHYIQRENCLRWTDSFEWIRFPNKTYRREKCSEWNYSLEWIRLSRTTYETENHLGWTNSLKWIRYASTIWENCSEWTDSLEWTRFPNIKGRESFRMNHFTIMNYISHITHTREKTLQTYSLEWWFINIMYNFYEW